MKQSFQTFPYFFKKNYLFYFSFICFSYACYKWTIHYELRVCILNTILFVLKNWNLLLHQLLSTIVAANPECLYCFFHTYQWTNILYSCTEYVFLMKYQKSRMFSCTSCQLPHDFLMYRMLRSTAVFSSAVLSFKHAQILWVKKE